MDHRIVRVGSLAEFRREVKESKAMPELRAFCALPVVRLSLTDQWVGGSQIPKKDVRLNLQGINDLDEIVWLMEGHTIAVFPSSGPETPFDASIAAGMRHAYDLVQAHLMALGYEVRGGSYGISNDIEPVKGFFECLHWHKADEEGRWVVEAGPPSQGMQSLSPQPSPSEGEGEKEAAA